MGNELALAKPDRIGQYPVVVKSGRDGSRSMVVAQVELSADRKEILSVGDNTMITAAGYYRMNQIAGISVITPPSVNIPGKGDMPNPYVQVDAHGRIEIIVVRKMAIGYSPIGNMVVTDETLHFNLPSYLLQDAMSLLKYKKTAGTQVKSSYLTEEQKKFGIFIPGIFDPITNDWLGVWIDFRQDDGQRMLSNHIQRQKFAERIASTICERNVMKKHPAIAKFNVQPVNGKVIIEVFGVVHDMDRKEINELASTVAEGRVDTRKVEYIRSIDSADSKEISVAETEVVSDSLDPKPAPVEQAAAPVAGPSETEQLVAKVRDMKDAVGVEAYSKIYRKLFTGKQVKSIYDLAKEDLSKFLELLNTEHKTQNETNKH